MPIRAGAPQWTRRCSQQVFIDFKYTCGGLANDLGAARCMHCKLHFAAALYTPSTLQVVYHLCASAASLHGKCARVAIYTFHTIIIPLSPQVECALVSRCPAQARLGQGLRGTGEEQLSKSSSSSSSSSSRCSASVQPSLEPDSASASGQSSRENAKRGGSSNAGRRSVDQQGDRYNVVCSCCHLVLSRSTHLALLIKSEREHMPAQRMGNRAYMKYLSVTLAPKGQQRQ